MYLFNHVSLVSSKRRHAGNLLSILSNVSFLFAANKTRSRERINKVDKTWISKRRRVASLGKRNCFAAGKLNDLPVRFGNERVPAYSRAKVEIACAQRPRGTKQARAIYPVANILRSIRRWKNRKESLRVGGVARNCVSAIRSIPWSWRRYSRYSNRERGSRVASNGTINRFHAAVQWPRQLAAPDTNLN